MSEINCAIESLKLHKTFDNPELSLISDEDISIAISALEKQIPQKPVRPYESNYKQYWNCPSCGSSGMCDVHKHCWRCGQKLDWEDGHE